ncbi:nucleotidyltransferase domain-containing protein [Enterococcus sp. AZ196]|uniref:nucleotidyltransferase domain-containing protein n=1 Tax=Enterococcus sp. AZ196 TaxID=2774659 RepID=UPI003D27C87C
MKSNSEHNSITSKDSFLRIIDLLNELDIRYWIEGGWGIDVLVGKQTRPHRDIDIDFDAEEEQLLLNKLIEMGYKIITDQRPTRAELYHPNYGYIDIHPFIISDAGIMQQANPEGGYYELNAEWFSKRIFEGRQIPCVSVEGQRIFHSGYDLRAVDHADLKALKRAFPQEFEC